MRASHKPPHISTGRKPESVAQKSKQQEDFHVRTGAPRERDRPSSVGRRGPSRGSGKAALGHRRAYVRCARAGEQRRIGGERSAKPSRDGQAPHPARERKANAGGTACERNALSFRRVSARRLWIRLHGFDSSQNPDTFAPETNVMTQTLGPACIAYAGPVSSSLVGRRGGRICALFPCGRGSIETRRRHLSTWQLTRA